MQPLMQTYKSAFSSVSAEDAVIHTKVRSGWAMCILNLGQANQNRLGKASSSSDRVCIFCLVTLCLEQIQILLGRCSTNFLSICPFLLMYIYLMPIFILWYKRLVQSLSPEPALHCRDAACPLCQNGRSEKWKKMFYLISLPAAHSPPVYHCQKDC